MTTTRSDQGLTADVRDRLGSIVLDRSERRNDLSRGLLEELAAVDDLGRDDDVCDVTVPDAANDALSTGMDLKELRQADRATSRPRVRMSGSACNHCELLAECAKPTVAVINGAAMGGGFELAITRAWAREAGTGRGPRRCEFAGRRLTSDQRNASRALGFVRVATSRWWSRGWTCRCPRRCASTWAPTRIAASTGSRASSRSTSAALPCGGVLAMTVSTMTVAATEAV